MVISARVNMDILTDAHTNTSMVSFVKSGLGYKTWLLDTAANRDYKCDMNIDSIKSDREMLLESNPPSYIILFPNSEADAVEEVI